MIQPTFKPAIKPKADSKGNQDSFVSASEEDNFESTPPLFDHSMNHSALPTLNKAELLALFTLPVSHQVDNTGVSGAHAGDTNVTMQRVAHYHIQHERTRLLYTASADTRPTYLVQTLKHQFVEYQQYKLAEQLDKRGLLDTDGLQRLWQQLHVVDDIIADIVHHMPAQRPAGWQLSVQDGHNPLCLPTLGKLKHDKPMPDQGSLNSYVLGHFGVSSFTYDRGYYIGHVMGYLFSCYFCAHLSISYGVSALAQDVVGDYDYASLETPHMVRLLQGLDGYCKKRIYQLAVICARLSVHASDKRIEKMLITEVNDFDKKVQQQHLDVLLLQGMMPESDDSTPLF